MNVLVRYYLVEFWSLCSWIVSWYFLFVVVIKDVVIDFEILCKKIDQQLSTVIFLMWVKSLSLPGITELPIRAFKSTCNITTAPCAIEFYSFCSSMYKLFLSTFDLLMSVAYTVIILKILSMILWLTRKSLSLAFIIFFVYSCSFFLL